MIVKIHHGKVVPQQVERMQNNSHFPIGTPQMLKTPVLAVWHSANRHLIAVLTRPILRRTVTYRGQLRSAAHCLGYSHPE